VKIFASTETSSKLLRSDDKKQQNNRILFESVSPTSELYLQRSI
jgi:hypothetical protein